MAALDADGCVELPTAAAPTTRARHLPAMYLLPAARGGRLAGAGRVVDSGRRWTDWRAPVSPISDASPRGILHVPKA